MVLTFLPTLKVKYDGCLRLLTKLNVPSLAIEMVSVKPFEISKPKLSGWLSIFPEMNVSFGCLSAHDEISSAAIQTIIVFFILLFFKFGGKIAIIVEL